MFNSKPLMYDAIVVLERREEFVMLALRTGKINHSLRGPVERLEMR